MTHGEPWRYERTKVAGYGYREEILTSEDGTVASSEPIDDQCITPSEEESRRIVASVNFCRNMRTGFLEAHELVDYRYEVAQTYSGNESPPEPLRFVAFTPTQKGGPHHGESKSEISSQEPEVEEEAQGR